MEEKEIIEHIENKRRFSKEVKDKMITEVFECAISAIIVYVYFIFLKLGIKNIHQDIYLTDLKVFQISLVLISITLFENAYYKKSSKHMCRGIEILLLAIITMLIQYLTLYLTPRYRLIIPLFAIIYNIYYVLKALVVLHKVKNEYRNNLSDIKEIVKKQPKHKK